MIHPALKGERLSKLFDDATEFTEKAYLHTPDESTEYRLKLEHEFALNTAENLIALFGLASTTIMPIKYFKQNRKDRPNIRMSEVTVARQSEPIKIDLPVPENDPGHDVAYARIYNKRTILSLAWPRMRFFPMMPIEPAEDAKGPIVVMNEYSIHGGLSNAAQTAFDASPDRYSTPIVTGFDIMQASEEVVANLNNFTRHLERIANANSTRTFMFMPTIELPGGARLAFNGQLAGGLYEYN